MMSLYYSKSFDVPHKDTIVTVCLTMYWKLKHKGKAEKYRFVHAFKDWCIPVELDIVKLCY